MGTQRLVCACIFIALPWASASGMAVFTVGGDGACNFTTLQTAIDAAENDTDPEAEIRVARSTSYPSVAIDITDHSMRIIGGYDTCLDPEPSGRTVLNGSGGVADTVIDIVGTANPTVAVLANLAITGGDPGPNNYGGGLSIVGNVEATLLNVSISSSTADLGGGIYIQGNLGAGLHVDHESIITSNTAHLGGGGIYCLDVGGDLSMQAVTVEGDLVGNTAGDGGGVYAQHCDYHQHGRTVGDGLLFNAASGSGGGIFATSGGVVILSGGPGAPVSVSLNSAGADGGAISLDGGSRLQGQNFAMVSNAATGDGGALYIGRASAVLGTTGRCAVDRCARIEDNQAGSEGGAIFHRGGGLLVEDTWLLGNSAPDGSVIKSQGEVATFRSVVVAGNRGATSVMRLKDGTQLVEGATFADNEDMNWTLLVTGGSLTLRGSIIWESVGTSVGAFGETPVWDIDCVLVHDPGALPPAGSTVLTGNPGFLDPAGDDYRINRSSPAIDVCVDFTGTGAARKGEIGGATDIDGYPRGQDLEDVPNLAGPYDLGASEYQEVLLRDGFESSGITL